MTPRNVGLVAPDAEEGRDIGLCQQAEGAGYDSIWAGEYWPRDAIVDLAEIACETDGIQLGTSIVNVYSRSPAVLSMAAMSLSRLSQDRFVLGLGASTPKLVEDLHGVEYDRPLSRVRETIELVQQFTRGDGEPVTYDGECVTVADFPSQDHSFPIYNAALGPKNRYLTGRLCDGWLPHNVPFSTLDDSFEAIKDGASAAERDPEEIVVRPIAPSVVDEDGDTARRHLSRHIAWYAGNSEAYNNAIGRLYPDRAERIYDLWNDGHRKDAMEIVDEEMRLDLGIAGSPSEAREQLIDLTNRSVVDAPIITIPSKLSMKTTQTTVNALAPANW